MKIDRLFGILNILIYSKRITVKELAERFEVSRRTILRDLDTLDKAGIPIITYSGSGGGISVIEGYSQDKNIFSKNDIKNIYTAISGLMSVNKNTDLINLMAKIIPEKTDNIFSESDYLIDLSSWFNDSITYRKISDFHKAIEEHKSISMEYISKNSRTVRTINPYKLVFKQSYWYLYGVCQENDEFRLFKVNRIVSYKILDLSFICRKTEKINFENNFSNIVFGKDNNKRLYKVVLEYDKKYEFFLTNKIDAEFFRRKSSEEKGRIVFGVNNLDFIADFIISMQDKAKIIEPIELKDKVKLKIEKMIEIYER